MSKLRKFYNFITDNNKHSLYVYGEIISGSDKWENSEVVFDDFRDTVEAMQNNSQLDIYINSPGGSVFATQGIVALLRRAKERGITINAYLDGLAASCASWLPMVADKVFAYPQSVMMIHAPYTMVVANAKEMQKEIEVLNKIQNDVIIPLYMEKAKEGVTVEQIQELMEAETWFNATEMAEIFDIELLEEKKETKMCVSKEILNKYRNTPTELLNQANSAEVDPEKTEEVEPQKESVIEPEVEPTTEPENTEPVVEPEVEPEKPEDGEPQEEPEVEPEKPEDGEPQEEPTVEPENKEVEELTNKLQAMQAENERLAAALNEANTKILSLNEKLNELQPIVDSYNAELAAKQAEEEAALLNEKRDFYKNKFERLGAANKFASKEVQELINKCLVEEKAEYELNTMLVSLIQDTMESSTIVKMSNKQQVDNCMDNLIPDLEDVGTKYGFR